MAITEHAVAFALCWRSGVIATKYQGQIEIRKPVWLTVAVKIEILEGTGQAGSKILFQSGVQSTESGTAQHPQTTGVIFSDRLCKANSQQMIANPQRRARRIIVAVKSNQSVEITAVIELKIVELQLRIFGKLPAAADARAVLAADIGVAAEIEAHFPLNRHHRSHRCAGGPHRQPCSCLQIRQQRMALRRQSAEPAPGLRRELACQFREPVAAEQSRCPVTLIHGRQTQAKQAEASRLLNET